MRGLWQGYSEYDLTGDYSGGYDPLLWPSAETPESSGALAVGETSIQSLWPQVAAGASEFVANYQAWQQNGPADLADALRTLREARILAGQQQAAALAAQDSAAFSTMQNMVATLDTEIAEAEAAQAQAQEYASTWDTIAAVIAAGGAMVGLGLPVIPVALTAAVAVAAVASLAYVVTTWNTTRVKANSLAAWTAEVVAGRLTTAQVAELAQAGGLDSGGGLLAGLLGGSAGMVLLLLGAAAVFLWPMRGK